MKKILSALAGLCFLSSCGYSGSQDNLSGKNYVLQNAENGAEITLEFAPDGNQYYGQAVNNYFGRYTVSEQNISFSGGGSTMMMGPMELMEAERHYFEDLEKVDTYKLDGDVLSLTTADGKILTFKESAKNE
ncbi:MAG: META domain-containing protein [Pseudomonadota bacterium]|nr:META domain-containing protein [Pseudomonadota bacterium]